MSANSKIEWCHHTFNPWWGCTHVSEGCRNCYAETFAKRTGHKVWGARAPRRMLSANYWRQPLKWNDAARQAGERHRVFCASMADVFEDIKHPGVIDARLSLWGAITETPHLDWLLLTKRPENFRELLPNRPSPNVWLGVSVEDQATADERIPLLIQTPAAKRFVSYEPALGPVDFRCLAPFDDFHTDALDTPDPTRRLDWIIVGGESGPGARPFDVEWARSTVKQCREAGVVCFVKQLGAQPVSDSDDDRRHCGDMNLPHPFRLILNSRKGGYLHEWPEDLRVREFPAIHRVAAKRGWFPRPSAWSEVRGT